MKISIFLLVLVLANELFILTNCQVLNINKNNNKKTKTKAPKRPFNEVNTDNHNDRQYKKPNTAKEQNAFISKTDEALKKLNIEDMNKLKEKSGLVCASEDGKSYIKKTQSEKNEEGVTEYKLELYVDNKLTGVVKVPEINDKSIENKQKQISLSEIKTAIFYSINYDKPIELKDAISKYNRLRNVFERRNEKFIAKQRKFFEDNAELDPEKANTETSKNNGPRNQGKSSKPVLKFKFKDSKEMTNKQIFESLQVYTQFFDKRITTEEIDVALNIGGEERVITIGESKQKNNDGQLYLKPKYQLRSTKYLDLSKYMDEVDGLKNSEKPEKLRNAVLQRRAELILNAIESKIPEQIKWKDDYVHETYDAVGDAHYQTNEQFNVNPNTEGKTEFAAKDINGKTFYQYKDKKGNVYVDKGVGFMKKDTIKIRTMYLKDTEGKDNDLPSRAAAALIVLTQVVENAPPDNSFYNSLIQMRNRQVYPELYTAMLEEEKKTKEKSNIIARKSGRLPGSDKFARSALRYMKETDNVSFFQVFGDPKNADYVAARRKPESELGGTESQRLLMIDDRNEPDAAMLIDKMSDSSGDEKFK